MEVKEPPSKPEVMLQVRMRKRDDSTFQCKDCGKCFPRPCDLVKHLWTHSEQQPVKCKLCAKSFNSMANLKKHHSMKHKVNVGNDKESMDVTSKKLEKEEDSGGSSSDEASSDEAANEEAKSKLEENVTDKLKALEPLRHVVPYDKRPYVCGKCGRRFSDKGRLINHQRFHEGKTIHRCVFCGSEFVSKGQLKVHERVHTGEKPYKCDFCPKIFYVLAKLYSHTREFHSDVAQDSQTRFRSFMCYVCKEDFPTKRLLVVHHDVKHKKERYQCKYCQQKFVYKRFLRIHERSHYLKSYKSEEIVERNELSDLTVSKKLNLTCENCGKIFSNKTQLQIHQLTHIGKEGFKCQYCPMDFFNSNTLLLHERSHTGEQPYKCDYCGRWFGLLGNLWGHIRTQHPDKELPTKESFDYLQTTHPQFSSQLPSQPSKPLSSQSSAKPSPQSSTKPSPQSSTKPSPQSSTKPSPQSSTKPSSQPSPQISAKPSSRLSPQPAPQHSPPSGIKSKGASEKRFMCDFCDKAFRTRHHLFEHRFIHTGKPLTCEICGQGYIRQSKFKTHQKIHRGNDVYTCDECGYKFPSFTRLESHKFQKHADRFFEEKHKCKYCDRIFIHHDNLKIHMQYHVEEEAQRDGGGETSGQSEGNSVSSSLERCSTEQDFTCKDCGTVVKLGCTTMSNVFAVADFSNVKCFLNNHRMI